MADRYWWDEAEIKVRLGRFSETDIDDVYREIGRIFRMPPSRRGFGKLGKFPSRREQVIHDGFLQGSNLQLDRYRYWAAPEVVVKSVSQPKTMKAIKRTLSYISNGDAANDNMPSGRSGRCLRDELGRELRLAEATAALDGWRLLGDNDNLSKRARELAPAARNEMPERMRFNHVQAYHFVWSIGVRPDDDKISPFCQALMVTLAYVFRADGHKAFWTVHRNTDHLHAHLVVQAQSDRMCRVRLDRHGDFLFGVRVKLASCLRNAGIDAMATRREDRPDLRERILNGEKPIRESWDIDEFYRSTSLLTECAPKWWSRHGKRFGKREEERRKAFLDQGRKPKAAVANKDEGGVGFFQKLKLRKLRKIERLIVSRERELFWLFADVFKKPKEAMASWGEFVTEGSFQDKLRQGVYPNWAFGNWLLIHRPWTFGSMVVPEPTPDWGKKCKQATRVLRAELGIRSGEKLPRVRNLRPREIDQRYNRRELIKRTARLAVWEVVARGLEERSISLVEGLLEDLERVPQYIRGASVRQQDHSITTLPPELGSRSRGKSDTVKPSKVPHAIEAPEQAKQPVKVQRRKRRPRKSDLER